jgi:hypothetical protein
MAAYSFDSKSGCRERLFLLSVISLKMDNPANYAYDPHRDTWACADGHEKQVRYEASHSLEILASRGIDRTTALEMVG